MKVRMLTPTDIYDFYGCDFLLAPAFCVDAEDRRYLEGRIEEIHGLYITACKARIKAEAKFLGVDVDDENFSISRMLKDIGSLLENDMKASADSMMHGQGFNLMGSIIKAHQASGGDLKGIDTSKFGCTTPVKKKDTIQTDWFKGKQENGRMIDDPKWAEIAKAYLDVENAKSVQQMIESIDRLNDLQHNSFHLLIDLQSGRMLEDKSTGKTDHETARQTVQDVLDMKHKSGGRTDIAWLIPKLSDDIAKLAKTYRKGSI